MKKRLRQSDYIKLKDELEKVTPFFKNIQFAPARDMKCPLFPFDQREKCKDVVSTFTKNLSVVAYNKVVYELYRDNYLNRAQFDKLIKPIV